MSDQSDLSDKKKKVLNMTQLRRIRLERKLTLRSIGEIVNVTPQTVHDTEVYGIRTVKTAKRYAAALNCDWRDLLDDGEEK